MHKGTGPKPKRSSAAVRSTQYPVRFWKVLAGGRARGRRQPAAHADGVRLHLRPVGRISEFGLGIKEAKASDFRNYQATLREVTEESGVEFDDVLAAHDVLAKVAEAERVRRLRTEEDVVVRY
jgi:hypothetical protein